MHCGLFAVLSLKILPYFIVSELWILFVRHRNFSRSRPHSLSNTRQCRVSAPEWGRLRTSREFDDLQVAPRLDHLFRPQRGPENCSKGHLPRRGYLEDLHIEKREPQHRPASVRGYGGRPSRVRKPEQAFRSFSNDSWHPIILLISRLLLEDLQSDQ